MFENISKKDFPGDSVCTRDYLIQFFTMLVDFLVRLHVPPKVAFIYVTENMEEALRDSNGSVCKLLLLAIGIASAKFKEGYYERQTLDTEIDKPEGASKAVVRIVSSKELVHTYNIRQFAKHRNTMIKESGLSIYFGEDSYNTIIAKLSNNEYRSEVCHQVLENFVTHVSVNFYKYHPVM